MVARSRRRIATTIGWFLLGVYISWNVWWLSLGRVPPSIMLAATGVPSPTTGGTRSFLAMMRGEVGLSLYHNISTFPILALTCVTVAYLPCRGSAPAWIGHAWCILLAVAFAAKLITHNLTSWLP